MNTLIHNLILIWLGFLLASQYFTLKFPKSSKVYQNVNQYVGFIGFGTLVFSIILAFDVITDLGFVMRFHGVYLFNWLLSLISLIVIFLTGIILGTDTLASFFQNHKESKILAWFYSVKNKTKAYRNNLGLFMVAYGTFLIIRYTFILFTV